MNTQNSNRRTLKPLLFKLIAVIVFLSVVFKFNDLHASTCEGVYVFNSQAEVDAFAPCDSIIGNITVEGEDITDISPLYGIKYVSEFLLIRSNPELTQIQNGFPNLTQASTLVFANQFALEQIDGFQNLEELDNFFIFEAPELLSISGFETIETIENFQIEGIQKLNSITGFSNFTESSSLQLVRAKSLKNLDFYSQIEGELENALVISDANLENIDGLSGITKVNFLVFGGDSTLTNLDGFQNLESIEEFATIGGLPELTDITGLSNLKEVGRSFSLVENENLNECCAIANFLYEAASGETLVSVTNNGENCNSPEEIWSACGIQDCISDVNLTSQAEIEDFALNGCDSLFGSLVIIGDDITDLTPLNFIKYIGGSLSIVNTSNLTTIEGFNNLTYIGEGLIIPTSGQSITSINGFENLEVINEFDLLILGQENLKEINGFNKLSFVNGIIIEGSSAESITAFDQLESVNRVSFVGSNVENLNFLSSLQEIGAITLANHENLVDLSGLDNLELVDGFFLIAGNPNLTSLHGLNQLEFIGDLRLTDNNLLNNVDDLESLTTLQGLTIHGNGSLNTCCIFFPFLNEDLSNGIEITNNSSDCNSIASVTTNCEIDDCQENVSLNSQEEVDNWLGCEEVVGTLTIEGDDITDLSPLSSLISAGDIVISNNPLLTSLDGFENFIGVSESFVVVQNESLSDITALTSLTDSGDFLYFLSNPSLINLDGLENLTTAKGLSFDGNEKLENIDALSSLTTINGLFQMIGSQSLQNIDGLVNITTMKEGFIFADCPNLDNIDALGNLTSLNTQAVVAGTNVSTLNGLQNLVSVDGYIAINANPRLTSLDGLSNLTSVIDFYISDNENLSDCCAIYDLLISDGIEGEFIMTNNPAPCSSQDDLIVECGDGNGGGFPDDTNVEGVDLSLQISANHDYYVPYKDIVLTITLSNFGTESTQDIVVDIPEASQQFGSGNFAYTWHSLDAIAAKRGSFDPTFTEWYVSHLDPGESISMDLVLYVLAEDKPLPVFTQILTSFPVDADAVGGNDRNGIVDEDDEASTVILPTDNTTLFTDLELNVTANKRTVEENVEVVYFVQVSNKSQVDATNISIAPLNILNNIDIIDLEYTNGLFDTDEQIWTIPVLEKKASTTLVLVTSVSNIGDELSYHWQVTAVDQNERDSSPNNGFGNNIDHEDDENSATVFPASTTQNENYPDLSIRLTSDTQEYLKKSFVTYTLNISNTGTAIANGVKVDWQVPEGLAHSDLLVSQGNYSSWSGIWDLVDPLDVDEEAEIIFTVWTQVDDRDITSYAQVIDVAEFDLDSTPGNGTCCNPSEDDEAAVTITPAPLGLGSETGLELRSANNTKSISFEVFPNPADENINIQFFSESENTELEVLNIQGQTVMARNFDHDSGNVRLSIEINELVPGMYYLRVKNNESIPVTSFVKTRD